MNLCLTPAAPLGYKGAQSSFAENLQPLAGGRDAAGRATNPLLPQQHTPPARILIADDYDDNRELLRLMLESSGHDVRETRNGHECVAAAQTEIFDLVLIDISMPHLDGWGALRALRADERTRTLPCVAITAYAAEPDRQRALAAGFNAFISKPYHAKELLAVVARLLAQPKDGVAQS